MALMYKEFMNDDRTDRVADRASANTVGMEETGFGVSIKNVFRKQGDDLRAQLQELGFGESEANGLEDQLDQGTVLVIVQDPPEGLAI